VTRAGHPEPRQRGGAMTTAVVCVTVFGLLLQSTFVSGIPLPYFATILLVATLGAADPQASIRKFAIAVALSALLLVVSFVKQVELLGAIKSAVGYMCFFLAALAVYDLHQRKPAEFELAARVAIWLLSIFFFLEYFGIFSAKSAGIAQLWTPSGIAQVTEFADPRPSGLYSEPSWLALALASAVAVHGTNARRVSWMAVILSLSVLSLCKSATAVLLLPLLLLLVLAARTGAKRSIGAVLIVATCVGAAVLVGNGILDEQLNGIFDRSIEKIAHPFETDSGWIRFVSPLNLFFKAASEDPFFGVGLGAVRDQLVGVAGTSMLPLNVALETGVLGLVLYGALITYMCRGSRFPVLRLALVGINVFFLGLHTSAFQATLIAMLLASPRPVSKQWLTA
jgi:hypothetical protein